jgi:hypothetical protein
VTRGSLSAQQQLQHRYCCQQQWQPLHSLWFTLCTHSALRCTSVLRTPVQQGSVGSSWLLPLTPNTCTPRCNSLQTAPSTGASWSPPLCGPRVLHVFCSYLYLDGRLLPVPASRADLFADRALSLADKRSLGRFMAACVEAAEGSGRLKVCSHRPQTTHGSLTAAACCW